MLRGWVRGCERCWELGLEKRFCNNIIFVGESYGGGGWKDSEVLCSVGSHHNRRPDRGNRLKKI